MKLTNPPAHIPSGFGIEISIIPGDETEPWVDVFTIESIARALKKHFERIGSYSTLLVANDDKPGYEPLASLAIDPKFSVRQVVSEIEKILSAAQVDWHEGPKLLKTGGQIMVLPTMSPTKGTHSSIWEYIVLNDLKPLDIDRI